MWLAHQGQAYVCGGVLWDCGVKVWSLRHGHQRTKRDVRRGICVLSTVWACQQVTMAWYLGRAEREARTAM